MRTSSTFDMQKFDFPYESGLNPIYNILIAYAEVDPQLGYTQGMNFLAGLIFVAVNDEVITFSILERILQSKQSAIETQTNVTAQNSVVKAKDKPE